MQKTFEVDVGYCNEGGQINHDKRNILSGVELLSKT